MTAHDDRARVEQPAPAPRYAVIHVRSGGGEAWPVVERVPGGWQSGAHHYPDADVLDVSALGLVPSVEQPAPAGDSDVSAVHRAARVMAQHYLDSNYRDVDRNDACICGGWVSGPMEPGWDDHLAEALSGAGLLCAHDDRARVEQPASAGDYELRKALDVVRNPASIQGQVAMAAHVLAAKCDEQGRELERLREIVRYMTEPDAEMAREFAALRARVAELEPIEQRARLIAQGEPRPVALVSVSAGAQARIAIARYILGEK